MLFELIRDHQNFHTDFQASRFITNAAGYGTLWGMYRQTLRELVARIEPLEDAYAEMPLTSPLREAVRVGVLLDREREFAQFYNQAVAFKAKVDALSPAEKEALEAEYWVEKFKTECAVSYMVSGRIEADTMSAIMALPLEMRSKILTAVHRDRAPELMEEIANRPDHEALVSQTLMPTEVKALLCTKSPPALLA